MVKSWYLFLASVIFFAIGVYFVRANNLHMVALRQSVFVADKSGKGLDQALTDLRNYINRHMGTSAEVPLKYSYERAAKAELAKIKTVSGNRNDIFNSLPQSCKDQVGNGYISTEIPCVKKHINNNLSQLANNVTDLDGVNLPNKDLYQLDFSSPLFTFDLAGMSLLLSVVLFISATALSTWRFIKTELAYRAGDIEGL